jgi:FkbM family methyltransferase
MDRNLIEVSRVGGSLKADAHLALAAFANAATRQLGVRPLLNPLLSLIGAIFGSGARIVLSVGQRVTIEVPLSDSYWVAAAMDGTYEPEILGFLDALDRRSTLFVDGGANIGWWALLAEKRWGWSTVAVEASSALVRRIERNRDANRARFAILHNALWRNSGETLTFKTGREAHAGGHLSGVAGFVQSWRVGLTEEVRSITVDDIVTDQTSNRRFERTLVKIDVEGAEREAIEGARETIDSGAVVIFEDHGSDPHCAVATSLLGMGLLVYALERPLKRIYDVGDVAIRKKNKRNGYNFLAVAPNTPACTEIDGLASAA